MNERIKQLAEQAGFQKYELGNGYIVRKELERFAELVRQDYLRELKALKPVGYIDKKGLMFNDTTHPHLHTSLYALDEVTK